MGHLISHISQWFSIYSVLSWMRDVLIKFYLYSGILEIFKQSVLPRNIICHWILVRLHYALSSGAILVVCRALKSPSALWSLEIAWTVGCRQLDDQNFYSLSYSGWKGGLKTKSSLHLQIEYLSNDPCPTLLLNLCFLLNHALLKYKVCSFALVYFQYCKCVFQRYLRNVLLFVWSLSVILIRVFYWSYCLATWVPPLFCWSN